MKKMEVNMVEEPGLSEREHLLPHPRGKKHIAKNYHEAVAPDAPYEDPDVPTEDELSDPVPTRRRREDEDNGLSAFIIRSRKERVHDDRDRRMTGRIRRPANDRRSLRPHMDYAENPTVCAVRTGMMTARSVGGGGDMRA